MQQHNKTPTKNPLFFAQSLKNLRKSFENESANAELYLTTASFQKPFPLQTRDFRFESLETRDFPLQTRDFPLETRDSALETRDFPSELAHFNENALILAQKGLISESTALLGSCTFFPRFSLISLCFRRSAGIFPAKPAKAVGFPGFQPAFAPEHLRLSVGISQRRSFRLRIAEFRGDGDFPARTDEFPGNAAVQSANPQ